MKITVRELKKLLAEVSGTEIELDHMISHMDPDTIADEDYVDSETGEVYLEKGEKSRKSMLHPQNQKDRDEAYQIRRAQEDAEWAKEEEELAREDEERARQHEEMLSSARAQFDAAVKEFAAGAEGYANDLTNSDVDLESVMPDMAENFFFSHPQWRDWARLLGMSRADMKSYVAEMAYEAALRA